MTAENRFYVKLRYLSGKMRVSYAISYILIIALKRLAEHIYETYRPTYTVACREFYRRRGQMTSSTTGLMSNQTTLRVV